jgi:putative holliday junction resolvase
MPGGAKSAIAQPLCLFMHEIASESALSPPSRVKLANAPHRAYLESMRAAALDLGSARIGIAIADELGSMAHPRPHLQRKPWPACLDALEALVKTETLTHFIVGLPLDMRGGEGDAAITVRRMAGEIARKTHCKIVFWDERLSTVQASRGLREQGLNSKQQRSKIDSASAVVLLQSWLDGQ